MLTSGFRPGIVSNSGLPNKLHGDGSLLVLDPIRMAMFPRPVAIAGAVSVICPLVLTTSHIAVFLSLSNSRST